MKKLSRFLPMTHTWPDVWSFIILNIHAFIPESCTHTHGANLQYSLQYAILFNTCNNISTHYYV